MHTITMQGSVTFSSVGELDLEARILLAHAIDVRRRSYRPYSGYAVGAAVSADDHSIHVGCNVERASYSQTTHAEQNAIDTMVAAAQGGRVPQLRTIAFVAAPAKQEAPDLWLPETAPPTDLRGIMMPCGHCRQCIWEHAMGPDVRVITMLPDRWVVSATIATIFPMPFGPSDL